MADTTNTYRTVPPYLIVTDADAELTFLKTAFGATEVMCQRNPDNTVAHAEITIGDSLVMQPSTFGSTTSTRRMRKRCAPERGRKWNPRPRLKPDTTPRPGSSRTLHGAC